MENKIKEIEERLLRKEQECEELKEKFQDMKKSRDVALKEYNEEFEYKRQITVEHLEQKKELLKQLDQLKTENEELKKLLKARIEDLCDSCGASSMMPMPCKVYEKALTEIKEIALKACECCGECQTEFSTKDYCDFNEILQKISEVEDEHNG